jgi:hypothetical protein
MALAPRTKKSLPPEASEYLEPPAEDVRIGIALSGGGIRAAAFNLGAMQALQAEKVLENGHYLAAVSGGNYVASAMAISAAYSDHDCENGKPFWGRGSPEERYLRQHTDYLAPGRIGKAWLVASMVSGFILNYLPFALCALIAGRVSGWLLSLLGLNAPDGHAAGLSLPGSWALSALLATLLLCLGLPVLLAIYRSFRTRRPGNYGESHSERIAYRLLLGAVLIGVILLLPTMAQLYGIASRWAVERLFAAPPVVFETWSGRLVMALVWLVASLLLAVAALVLSRRFRALRLMLVLSSLAGAGFLLVPLLSAVEYAARYGFSTSRDVLEVAGYAVIVLAMAVCVHNRRYSMHHFYRERLNSAFALRRRRGKDDRIRAEPIGFDERLYFSGLTQDGTARLPELIVCCAVNLTTDVVPVGRFAESFTFGRDVSGGPLFGYHSTERFEGSEGLAGTQLTVPSIMAVSGAALSPLMGRYTYPPLRLLMALTNVRLGVWIKNPLHRSWRSAQGRQSRGRTWLTSLGRSIRDGWFEPGALYVLREALGGAKSDARFIYLTDGGHWENLGLVELLRRQCTHVLCFDASADQVGAGLDIGRAIALARTELGAEIKLDPRPVLTTDDLPEHMAVKGTISYPSSTDDATLVYAKAVLTENASWDLHAFKSRDGRFPNHSTSQQMFTDEQFEAYRALGFQAAGQALTLLNLPDALLSRGQTPSRTGNGHGANGHGPNRHGRTS